MGPHFGPYSRLSLGPTLWANLGDNLGVNLGVNLGDNLGVSLGVNLGVNLGDNLLAKFQAFLCPFMNLSKQYSISTRDFLTIENLKSDFYFSGAFY